ncbi:hypothetical protein PAPYR_4818 [Paratrimastix pyriformis]|uniref:Uncharacterized protein n=1 Tax=Paratrimastix pyriformis TaxID=342808 RepID=A0ABQ8UJ73_9EUKA|nr:hypothetical protein PAPYR_4818 [Paratrimastix pyriformis]
MKTTSLATIAARSRPLFAPGDDLWMRLPPELLRAIVEASSCPLQTYIQLLSFSHVIRTGIRGTLRELSLVTPDPFQESIFIRPAITTDALAALIGPCRSLHKLSFPRRGVDAREAALDAGEGWVDEAFGGHTELATLEQLPELLPEPVIERILSHLSGLVELRVSPRLLMSTRLFSALARSCPDLQVLQCSISDDPTNIDALAPLSGVLKKLDLHQWLGTEERLAAFVRTLSAVSSLKLHRCPPAALEPIASHLTALVLTDHLREEGDLPGPWLCHLEELSLDLHLYRFSAPLPRLLDANQATLRDLTLELNLTEAPSSLMASLRALPHLARLDLVASGPGCSLSTLLPPDLVDRLERLNIVLPHMVEPVRIASSRIQQLVFRVPLASTSGLALDCPALVELDLSSGRAPSRLTLQCPRLRTLRLAAAWVLDGAAPMPHLEVVAFSGGPLVDPAWLLTESSPRLRELSYVRLTRPDLLARLCACGSLVRLEQLHLDVTRLPNPLVLRLPGQLERLDLRIRPDAGAQLPLFDLQVEAPGLLDFSLDARDLLLSSVRVQLHSCPELVCLALKSIAGVTLSLQVDEGEEAESGTLVAMQPLCLSVSSGFDGAGLLGLLTRHGARLREIRSWCRLGPELWPQLMQALSGLPRLTDLTLNVSGAPSPLSLACPHLRRLDLDGLPGEAKVLLACPLLGWLTGIRPHNLLPASRPPSSDGDL